MPSDTADVSSAKLFRALACLKQAVSDLVQGGT
jgi:hypothetical protein